MRKWLPSVLFLGVFLLVMLAVANGYYRTEFEKKPIVREKLDSGDYSYLYGFYVSNAPEISGRDSYGEPDAPITIIAYIDIDSDTSRYFMQELFPRIEEGYIAKGSLRFIPKYYLTADDYASRTERFKYASYLECIREETPERFFQMYFGLFNSSAERSLALNHGCSIEGLNMDPILEDLSEIENFGISLNPRFYIGIDGKDNTIIDGVPSMRKIERVIRDYQTRIGE